MLDGTLTAFEAPAARRWCSRMAGRSLHKRTCTLQTCLKGRLQTAANAAGRSRASMIAAHPANHARAHAPRQAGRHRAGARPGNGRTAQVVVAQLQGAQLGEGGVAGPSRRQ